MLSTISFDSVTSTVHNSPVRDFFLNERSLYLLSPFRHWIADILINQRQSPHQDALLGVYFNICDGAVWVLQRDKSTFSTNLTINRSWIMFLSVILYFSPFRSEKKPWI